MAEPAEPFQALVEALRRLPGIGSKTATRLAFHVMRAPREEVEGLARCLREVRERMRHCSTCGSLTDVDPCRLCSDPGRDQRLLVVVEEPANVLHLERSHFRGRYHVLGGALSPLRGIGPEDLRIPPLLERVRAGTIEEVILATNPTSEGEATAHYLARLLKPLGPKVSRIGFGLPVGSDLDYADEVTLGKALEGRREI
jgi:recombination protein RecR